MTTLVKQFEKQVEIPSDRRLTIDLPPEIPVGEARVTIEYEPRAAQERAGKRPLGFLKGKIKIGADIKKFSKEDLIRLFGGEE